jgi:hypothetical protein
MGRLTRAAAAELQSVVRGSRMLIRQNAEPPRHCAVSMQVIPVNPLIMAQNDSDSVIRKFDPRAV